MCESIIEETQLDTGWIQKEDQTVYSFVTIFIVEIYFLSLSNTQDNICINIHFDHISIKDDVHISTHEVMFASNRRLKLESFTSHSSSNFALQINVIFAFLVLSQTLPFEHLWPKSPSPRPFSLGPPGNK